MALSIDDAFASLRDPSTGRDPVPLYKPFLTRSGPAQLSSGDLVVGRYSDVIELLRNPRCGKLKPPPMPTRALRIVMRMFLSLDPPEHTRLRKVVAPHFTVAAVAEQREMVRQIARAALDALPGSFDLVRDYAYPVPFRVICRLVGSLEADQSELFAWTHVLTSTLDEPLPMRPRDGLQTLKAVRSGRIRPVTMFRAVHGIVGYARDRIAHSDAPIALTLRDAVACGDLSGDEAAATWVLLFLAGHETSANLIANTAQALLTHPSELAKITDDPGLLPAAIEETLRWDPPVPINGRVTHDDVELGGVPIPKGTFVHAIVGAANRDPDMFNAPDDYVVDRTPTPHLGFGQGVHFCLGAHLARLEAELVLNELFSRAPHPTTPPARRGSFTVSGFDTLPVEVAPANIPCDDERVS